jgi:hypothetical protein
MKYLLALALLIAFTCSTASANVRMFRPVTFASNSWLIKVATFRTTDPCRNGQTCAYVTGRGGNCEVKNIVTPRYGFRWLNMTIQYFTHPGQRVPDLLIGWENNTGYTVPKGTLLIVTQPRLLGQFELWRSI